MRTKTTILLAALMVTARVHVGAQPVRVAAAANLRFVLDDIKALYQRTRPGATVEVTLGSSGLLLQQITNGAPFDFFMAADRAYAVKLKEQGCTRGEIKTYAVGRLALWSDVVDVGKGIGVVLEDSVMHIAIAKPGVAPYGERAIQCLTHYGLLEKVRKKLVYAENIAQAAQFAVTGNAEVGFVALALVLAPDMKGKGNYIILDPGSYAPVEQACVLVKARTENAEAAAFMDFVLSAACRPIFEKYGYRVP